MIKKYRRLREATATTTEGSFDPRGQVQGWGTMAREWWTGRAVRVGGAEIVTFITEEGEARK